MRCRLIELLRNAKAAMKSENLSCDIARNMFVADFLIANGVTVQECISVKDMLQKGGAMVLRNTERLQNGGTGGLTMDNRDRSTIQRMLGVIEGAACGAPDNIATPIMDAVAVINEVLERAADNG